MGQKVNPHGFRVGINKPWESQWYADKNNFSKFILADDKIRKHVNKKYSACGISRVVIERTVNKLTVYIYASRPGMLIGVKGAEIEVLKKDISVIETLSPKNVTINIREVKRPDLDANLVAQSVAGQLEKRVSYKRACKMAVQKTMKAGAKGIKIMVGGRLNGAEIAQSEFYHEGSLPLQTLRADIDYGFAIAHTTFGVIGVKCWIYKGDILLSKTTEKQEEVKQDVNA